MEIRELIINSIKKVLGQDFEIHSEEIKLDVPTLIGYGEYSSNIAMIMFTRIQHQTSNIHDLKSPKEFAEAIAQRLIKDNELTQIVSDIKVEGPGFINFYLKSEYLIKVAQEALELGNNYGKNDKNEGKTVIVEYSSPNIAKPFTVGHLRSTIIGDSVANLLEANGWRVLRDNHLGDWGTQFGKQICAIKKWGDENEILKSDNPVKELVDLYVKFHTEAENDKTLDDEARAWFKKLEDGDEEARHIWKMCIDLSFKEFDRIYDLLDVKFSFEFENGRGLGESFFEDKMDVVIDALNAKNMLKEGEEGAKLVFFEDEKYPPAMILKKDGSTLYHTRDLAADKFRLDKYKPDLILNEVGSEQNLYFRQLFEMEKLLGWFKDGQRYHLGHGLIRFKEGKMSTRKGNVIWLEEVLGESVERARKLGSESAELAHDVGIGALKWNDLKRGAEQNVVFDWDEILNMQGNSGPYVQYTVARAKSVLEKAEFPNSNSQFSNYKLNNEELDLLRSFILFPEVVMKAGENYVPNLVCNYLFELAQKYNAFYNQHGILEQRTENKGQSEFRLFLTRVTSQILTNGLKLLGINAPEKM